MMYLLFFFFFFKQKTAYEMRISDWSSDVCSSDLSQLAALVEQGGVGQVLCEAPVAGLFAGDHLAPVLVDLGHARMQLDPVGDGVDRLGELVERGPLDRGIDRVGQLARKVLRPVDGEFVRLHLGQLGGDFAGVELVAMVVRSEEHTSELQS